MLKHRGTLLLVVVAVSLVDVGFVCFLGSILGLPRTVLLAAVTTVPGVALLLRLLLFLPDARPNPQGELLAAAPPAGKAGRPGPL